MIWAIVAICVLISFLFSGIEAGILSVNRVRLRHRVKLGDPPALKLNRLLARPERILVTVLIVTNLANIFAVALTTRGLVRWLGLPGYTAAVVVCLPFYLVGVEVLPKSLFRRFPYRALAAFSGLLRIADLVFSPIVWLGSSLARIAAPGGKRSPRKIFAGREDFKYFTIEGERVGTLTTIERDMIHNIVDFRALTARDVMKPISEVRTIPITATLDEAFAFSRTTAIDHLPVVGTDGNFAGLINIFEVMLDRAPGHDDVRSYMRRLVTVPPEEQAFQIIRKLRAARLTVAAVVDPAGATVGIVKLEDAINRLVSTAGQRSVDIKIPKA